MFRLLPLIRSSVVLATCFLFLIFVNQIYAAKSCVPTGQYDGPAANIPFDSCSKDCGCPDIGSDRFYDEIDNNSSVVCVENPELVAKVTNPKGVSLLNRSGSGRASYNFSFIDSFALKPELQKDFNPEQLNLLLPALNLPDRFDDSLSDALCVYESKFDRTECAQYLGSTLIDGVSENILATSWFSKRTTSIQSQFETKKLRLAQIVRCMNGSAGALEPCDQNYTVVKNPKQTAEEIAKKYHQITYEEFRVLPQPEQMKILAIRETRASSPVCIVVKKSPIKNSSYFINLFTDEEQVSFICGYIPGISATREATKTMMQRLSTQAVGQQAAMDITASLAKPTTGKTPEERMLSKIENAGITCDSFSPDYQSMGSQGPSRNNPEEKPLILNWFFDILNAGPNNLPPMKYVYQAYLIGPTESIAQFMGKNPQAAMRNLFPADQSDSVGKEAFLPQPLTTESPTANYEEYLDSSGDSCDPVIATDCAKVSAKFSAKQNIQAGLQGGEAVNNMLAVGHKLSWSQNNPSYFTSMCWANELAQKLQSNPVLGGIPLFSLIGRKVDSALTNCPSDFISTKSPSSGGQCSGTMGKALTAADGSCKLCNLDQFGQTHFGDDNVVIPPKMQEILESAAEENNVPASLILGIMFAEGGFERSCYNPSENGKWTDEMVCAKEVPNCNTCNVAPSTGARGPFQIIDLWFPKDKFGDPCNFTDSARTIASNHRTEKDGNPCWVIGTTDPFCNPKYAYLADVTQVGNTYHCGNYTVNVGGTRSGYSCDNWTAQDVATVARAFRGACDEEYINRVIGVWEKYTCK